MICRRNPAQIIYGLRFPIFAIAISFTSYGWAGVSRTSTTSAPTLEQEGASTLAVCTACHSLKPDVNAIGPTLYGVSGRKAGAVPGFVYSAAMKVSGIVWTANELAAYIGRPGSRLPGTSMAFAGIPPGARRDAVVAFLQSPEAGAPTRSQMQSDGPKRGVVNSERGRMAIDVGSGLTAPLVAFSNGPNDGSTNLSLAPNQCTHLIVRYAQLLGLSEIEATGDVGDGKDVARNFATKSGGQFRYVGGASATEPPVVGAVVSIGTIDQSGRPWRGNPYGHVGIAMRVASPTPTTKVITLFDQNFPLPSGQWKPVTFTLSNGVWRGSMSNSVGRVTQNMVVAGWANPMRRQAFGTVGIGGVKTVTPVILSRQNTVDVWTTSVFSYTGSGGGPGGGKDDDELRVGGWGDTYVALIRFPVQATSAKKVYLELYNQSSVYTMRPTPIVLNSINEEWAFPVGQRLWWAQRPSWTQIGSKSIVVPPFGWIRIDITNWYQDVINQRRVNYGLALTPTRTDNYHDRFSSSNATNFEHRPRLIFEM